MRAKKYIFSVLFVFFLMVNGTAQHIVGLWGITSVLVGNENMTPVAKWTRINR